MSERPFPPSARRLALARRAGLNASSPVVVGGIAFAAMALGVSVVFSNSRSGVVARIGTALADACAGRTSLDASSAGIAAIGNQLALSVLAIAAPIVVAVAVVALAGQLAQTRALWLPRRRIDGAPTLDNGPAARTRRAALDLAFAAAIISVAFAWLWFASPRIAALVELDAHDMLVAGAALVASALAALAVAYVALGIVDALARHAAVAHALAMTAADKREDERLAAADPRWARERAALARPSLEGATVLILGDDAAVAIAWDARRRPVPTRVATGRRAYATQLLGLARRHGIPVHRDATLAASLVGAEGPVPAADWPAVATVIAALRR
jgi:flagellar biosynthesis protein FlhB